MEMGTITEDIFVLDETIMPTFKYQYTGSLVFTPGTIYFISSGKVSNVKLGAMAGAGAQFGVIGWTLSDKLVKREFKKAHSQTENIENIINELEKLVLEKEGSIKISKIEIDSFKVPTGMLTNSIKVKTNPRTLKSHIES